MPDPIKPTVEPVVEPIAEPTVEPVVEPVTDPVEPVEPAPKAEPKRSIVDRIGDMISGAKKAREEAEAGDDIPDDFTEAANKMGWSTDQIIEFASDYTDEQLKEMIPSLTGADAAQADDPAKAPATPESEPKPKVEDSQDDDRLTQALDRIAELEKAQGIQKERSAEEELQGFVNKASDLFDKVSEEFEVFGKTDNLPTFPDGRIIPTSPQMKARNEVWGMAMQLKEAGMPNDQALEVSLNAYKGQHLATQTKRNVIKELKKNEQRLGGKRTSHETSNGNGEPLSGPDLIQEVARRHGFEMPD